MWILVFNENQAACQMRRLNEQLIAQKKKKRTKCRPKKAACSLHTSEDAQVNCRLVLISSAVVLIVLEWSNRNQCGGIIRGARGERGAAVFLLQVFNEENILIRPDKTRICLILLQACTLNYSRPTLPCLLSLCEEGADGAAQEPTVLNLDWLSLEPIPAHCPPRQ